MRPTTEAFENGRACRAELPEYTREQFQEYANANNPYSPVTQPYSRREWCDGFLLDEA